VNIDILFSSFFSSVLSIVAALVCGEVWGGLELVIFEQVAASNESELEDESA
jgi:hypothetical protein